MTAKHYLFDWGDTLMVDLPNQTGPMCNWPKVQVVDGALQCLKHLSQHAKCHLATNAEDSTEIQIRQALQRAGLSDYIHHIFCRENLAVGKTDPAYYGKIVRKLAVPATHITMIGDSLERDIIPALQQGLNATFYNPAKVAVGKGILSISRLQQLV
ncbi:HAD family hydrolase [Paraglaciecola aquimarina]|uniref:HAD family hydrolase n=1 Tax=Paraglaciecola aquimarina TaxID=1235557 RepID=A0ABU3STI0_9ALTE|nr:HAD family hydrolase [Paraglaciecola aquimarina]MDU0353312.1 HAD family hydrolase [Paraglaciecola aquimarina]